MPALGGKVWAAVHKPTGRDIVYCNHAVKFRNIAMRGPWCSGGIEFNFGIIGHAPSTSAPVDWFVRTNADGSASCFVGDTEAICRTSWQVEVNVRDGEDFFTTRVKWFNGSGLPVPYYQWMNAAFPARSDTEFVYPGANWIGHDGQAHTWPRDAAGRDWSRYACLAFGDAKSCHVLNGDHGVFGAWWPEIGFGSMHRSGVADKYGRKIFLWAQSRAGGIWEDLLTDSDGQYVELQSGRCFNQPESASSVTPFKHPSFAPGVTDAFEERWCAVTNRVAFDACVKEDGTYVPRPLALSKDFDRNSAYGHYVAGVQELNQRHDRAGAAELAKCLAKEPHFAPAHDALALLAIRRGLYADAHRHAESALAVDTYDGAANYADGLAYFFETNLCAASERLGLAAYSPLYRAAAFARLAVIELRRGRLDEAERMAERSLASEARQLDALRVRIVAARLKGDLPRAKRLAQEVLEAFPLCHAARYELQRLNPANIPFETFVRSEHPARTYADLGAWYAAAGLNDDAATLYARAAASDPVAAAKQAFLRVGSRDVLAAGARLPAAGVAPFRAEDLPALEAAVQANVSWKYAYYRAVLLAALGRDAEADAALKALGTVPDEAVFYQYRASRRKGAEAFADLDCAAACGDNWRIGIARFKLHEKAGDWKAAWAAVKPYVKPGATAEPVKVAYATALAESGAFAAALDYLRGETVLPSEFGFNAFGAWNRACRGLAEEALARGDETAARKAAETAVSYPENLGVGRPYEIKLDKAPFDAWKGRARTLLEEASWSKHPSP